MVRMNGMYQCAKYQTMTMPLNVQRASSIIVAYISPLVLCSINSTCENTFSTVYKTILSGYVASPLSNGPPWTNTENSYAMRACTGIYAHDIQLRHAAKREWHAMNYNFMHYLPASLRWSLINAASTEPTTAHGDLPGIPQNLLTVRAGQTTDFCRCHQGGGPITVKICAASGVAGVHATCLRHIGVVRHVCARRLRGAAAMAEKSYKTPLKVSLAIKLSSVFRLMFAENWQKIHSCNNWHRCVNFHKNCVCMYIAGTPRPPNTWAHSFFTICPWTCMKAWEVRTW